MLESIRSSLQASALQRALLLVNHCVAAEPAATDRLVLHAGRQLLLSWRTPSGPWPRPPDVALMVTPAGLFELLDAPTAAVDLRVDVDLPPLHRLAMQWLDGARPAVSVDGDAQLAADIAWLSEHLRWDIEHDLSRVIGVLPAHQLARLGAALRDGLRRTWDRRPAQA